MSPPDEARELDPKADHQLKVEFGDGQFWVTLLCPESGCTPAWDAPDGGDECWLKGWAEASVIDEGLVGEVIVAVSTSWDGDGPVSKIVADAQLVEWRERAEKAEAEADRLRVTMAQRDELQEALTTLSRADSVTLITGFREMQAERDEARKLLEDAQRQLRWVDEMLALRGVPKDGYHAQAGGVCDYTRAGRIDWLTQQLSAAGPPLGAHVTQPPELSAERDEWKARAEKAEGELVDLAEVACQGNEREKALCVERDALSSRLREAEGIIEAIAVAVRRCTVEVRRATGRPVHAHAVLFQGEDWFSVQAAADFSASPTPTEEEA